MIKSPRGLAAALVATVVGIVLCTAAFAWHEGYHAYVVRTGSMAPTFRPGDAVVDRPASSGYAIGDPITVEVAPGTLVTHRLRTVGADGKLLTKGDANKKPDAWRLNPSQVRGVVASGLSKMGYVLVFLRQKTGVAGVMTSALALVLLWGICFPTEEEPPTRQDPPRMPSQRRGSLVRIPSQRTPGQGVNDPVAAPTAVQRRMPPTLAPYRRVPPTRPPLLPRRPLLALPVPRPRTA